MPSAQLILGTATGYGWPQVEGFARSLRKTDYAGEVVLLVSDSLPSADRAAMETHGITLVTLPSLLTQRHPALRRVLHSFRLGFLHQEIGRHFSAAGPDQPGRLLRGRRILAEFQHIGCSRFLHYLTFLSATPDRYQHVMLTDVRDLVFQANPFAYAPAAGLVCALETKRETLSTQLTNARWLNYLYGPAAWQQFADCQVSCAGTTLGTTKDMLRYLAEMAGEIARLTRRLVGQDGLDQAVHNFLLRSGRLPPAILCTNGTGPFATLHGEDLSIFPRSPAGLLLNNDGRPVPVVHQYDRHPDEARRLFQALGLTAA
jgi:hypothetical protein